MKSHTVPRRLLEQFAFPDGHTKSLRLWRYRKGLPPRCDVAPKKASQIPRYFGNSNDPQQEMVLEQRLNAEVESPVHLFLPKLASGQLCFDDHVRAKLARYIVLLFSRSRARRQGMAITQALRRRLLGEALDCETCMQTAATSWNLQVHLSGVRTARLFEPRDIRAIVSAKLIDAETETDQQDAFASWIKHLLDTKTDDTRLADGRWHLLRTSEQDPFLLSDSPVISYTRRIDGQVAWGEGFNRPTVEVILPISPTACLHILPSHNVQDWNPPTTEEVNILQAKFIHESGYTNRCTTHLESMVNEYAGKAKIGENCYTVDSRRTMYYLLDTLIQTGPPQRFLERARNTPRPWQHEASRRTLPR